jgi:uncharacterized protein (DUF305 family)
MTRWCWPGLVAVSVAMTLGGCAGRTAATPPAAQHDHAAMMAATGAAKSTPGFQQEMDVGMAQMMTDMHSPGYSGNPDIDFLAMMVPHHQGAVDMARLVLLHGRDPTVRMLAEEIIAGQTVEIESMQRRLRTLRKPAHATEEMDFPVLGGTRGP